MITIEQTVDVPANGRISLVLPKTVPSGKANLRLIFTPIQTETPGDEKEVTTRPMPVSKKTHCNPPLDMREAHIAFAWNTGRTDDSSRKYAGCLKGKSVFAGDPVEIQRKMRSEW
jgi:hypothetical protein